MLALLAMPALADSLAVVSGGNQTGLSGAPSAQPVVVEARTAGGVPIPGRTIAWSASNGLTLAASSNTTDANGQASMNFTYGFTGTATITANDGTSSEVAQTSATAVGGESLVIVSGNHQSDQIGATSQPIVVELRSAAGAPIVGRSLQWSNLDGNTQVTAPTSITDSGGRASMTFRFVDAQPPALNGSPSQIRASAGGGGPQVVADANVLGLSVILTTVSGVNQSIYDEQTSQPLVVQATTWDGQPLAGVTISWSEEGAPGYVTLSNASVVTDANGFANITFFCAISGGGTGLVGTIIASAGPAETDFAYHCQWGGSVALLSPNGVSAPPLSPATPMLVEVRDGRGNISPGVTVTWSVNSGDATLGAATSVTDALGQASVAVTTGTVFSQIRATVPGNFRSAGYSINPTNSIRAVSGYSQQGTPGSPGTQPLVVELRDSAGNPIVGQTINWVNLNGVGVALTAASSITDGSGQASMTFAYQGMGATQISADDGGFPTYFIVTATGYSTLQILSGANQTGLVGTHSAQDVVVELRDASGNLLVGKPIEWNVNGGSAVFDAPTSVTNGSGQASMGFTYPAVAGISGLEAREPSTQVLAGFFATAMAADALNMVGGNGQSGMPGTPASVPLTVELRDSSGAPWSGQNISWSATGGAVMGAASTATNGSGQANNTFTFPNSGVALTGTITATDGASRSVVFQYSVSVTQPGLSFVSGAGQVGEPGTDAAEPIVVQLLSAGGAPVVGQSVTASVLSGDASFICCTAITTDANGQASFSVHFGAAGVTSTLAFTTSGSQIQTAISTTVAFTELPVLTPEQGEVAVALDNSCQALAEDSSLTPEEQDFLARCGELAASASDNPSETVVAIEEMINDTVLAQSSAVESAALAQLQNVNARLANIRSGSNSNSLGGITLMGAGGSVSLDTLFKAFAGEPDAVAQERSFGRWGVWANGTIGRGETQAGSLTPGYDFDISGLTFGADYRASDHWLVGTAVGYSRQDTELDGNGGSVDMQGWSLTAYSTYNFKDAWYLDGVLIAGRNDFDIRRNLRYTLNLASGPAAIDQVASGSPGGSYIEAALTFGGDFHRQALSFGPYARVSSTRTEFDAYEETMQSGPGFGLGLAVEERQVDALSAVFGGRVAYAHSSAWGVLLPYATLEWQHEFKDDPDAVIARFIHDPTQTAMVLQGDRLDSNFLRLGLGLSWVMTKGRSGFFQYQRIAAREGNSLENLTLGFRWEF